MLRDNQILYTESECLEANSIQLDEPQTPPQQIKRPLHWMVYFINLLMMISIPPLTVFHLFWITKNLEIKAYVGMGMIGISIVVMIITCINLKVSLGKVFKALIIIDSILISLGIVFLAFFGMMHFLDRGKWEMKILQVTFAICSVIKMLNIRILLLYMKWKRAEIIIYKIGLYFMALTFFCVGAYCLYTNYSFTYNILRRFDQQCRYFVVLFTFAAFDFCARLVATVGTFDFTDSLRYVYIMKSMNQVKMEQRQKIIKTFKNFPQQKNNMQNKQVHMIPVVKVRK